MICSGWNIFPDFKIVTERLCFSTSHKNFGKKISNRTYFPLYKMVFFLYNSYSKHLGNNIPLPGESAAAMTTFKLVL